MLLLVFGLRERTGQVRSREEHAFRLMRRGLEEHDPALLTQARRAFLDASAGPFVRSEALLLANLTVRLRDRMVGNEPLPGPGKSDDAATAVAEAEGLLSEGRIDTAREVLEAALGRDPGSPVLRFYLTTVRSLSDEGTLEPTLRAIDSAADSG